MNLFIITLFSLMLGIESHAMGQRRALPDPEVVPTVELNRYVGLWYDVAHSPNFFQKKCKSSTAEYQVLDSQTISVFNTCYQNNGKTSTIRGTAKILNPAIPAKLKVVFEVIFKPKGNYWITELDPHYQWAVVSGPGKTFTFILSRTKAIAPELRASILSTLKAKGYSTDDFIFDQYN